MTLKELRDKRGKLIADARALLDAASKENRDLTDDESKKYDEIFAEAQRLKEQIDREERQVELEREAREAQLREAEQRGDDRRGDREDRERTDRDGDDATAAERRMQSFRNYLLGGVRSLSEAEFRALQADSDPAGGYVVPPVEFVNDLIKFVDDQVFMRRLARVDQIGMAQSGIRPSLENDPADADWTAEIATGSEDSTMDFGARELNPHPLAKRIKVSNKLLRLSPLGVEALVRERLGYKFAVSQEKGFLTGSGANQPLGVFTASAMGISTGRDVSAGNTTTSPTFDGLIEAKYSLKAAYWPRAQWIMHRDIVKLVAKLKDGEGQYIWQASVQAGQPDRLLNMPLNMSEYAPNTATTGLYVGILGDFMSGYWILDALSMQMQRLNELYAETNQTGFIGRLETDGMPVLEEAFARVKLA